MEYLRIAEILTNNAECRLIGSLSLMFQHPEILERKPSDADFYASDEIENILNIIGILKDNGYEVYSWQDRIDEKFDFGKLKGRFYIRGICDGKNIDITYEIEGLNYFEMKVHETDIQGIKMYDTEGIMILLSKSDKEKNKRQLARLAKKTGFQ